MFTKQVEVMQKQLDRLSLFHDEMRQQLSVKASNLMAEIMSQQMPRPRFWRSSSSSGIYQHITTWSEHHVILYSLRCNVPILEFELCESPTYLALE